MVRSSRQKPASLNAARIIYGEYLDSRAPHGGDTFDNRSPQAEMIEPTTTPRIKQRHNLTRNRIDAGLVWAFPEIAAVTGKGQIAGIVGPAMPAGYNKLDVMSQGTTILRKLTIFAAVPSGLWFSRVPAAPTPSLRGVGKLHAGP